MRKKYIMLVLILIIFTLPLISKDFSMVGTGTTPEEAKNMAVKNMANYLSAHIYSTTEYSNYDDGNKSTSIYKESSQIQSDMELWGLQCRYLKKISDDIWQIEVYISEDNIQLYKNKANNAVDYLNGISINDIEDPIILLALYYELQENLNVYNISCQILKELGCTDSVKKITQNLSSLSTKIRSITNNNITELRSYIRMLNAKIELSAEELEILEQKETALSNIEAHFYKDQERIEAEQKRLFEELNQFEKNYLASLSSAKHSDISNYYEDPFEIIIDIENNKDSCMKIKNSLDISLSDLYEEFKVNAEKNYRDILNRPYKSIEKDKSGYPTDLYLNARIAEADYAILSLFQVYAKQAQTMVNHTATTLQKYAEATTKLLNKLQNSNFTICTPNESITTYIESFNPEKGIWYGNANLYIAGQEIEIPFEIPFTGWTNKEKPEIGSSRWAEYTDITDSFHKIFTQYPNSYKIEINYNLSGSLDNNIYKLSINSINIIEPKSEHIVSTQTPNNMSYAFPIGINKTNIGKIVFNNEFGITESNEIFDIEIEPEKFREQINKTKELLELEYNKSLGIYSSINTLYSNDIILSFLSLGLRYKLPFPLWQSNYFAAAIGGNYAFDSFLRTKYGGIDTSVSIVSYIDSTAFIEWALLCKIDFPLNSSDSKFVCPGITVGIGQDTKWGTFKGSISYDLIIPISNHFKPSHNLGMNFSWVYSII